MHWRNLKILFSWITRPVSTKLRTNHLWVMGISVCCSSEESFNSHKGNNGYYLLLTNYMILYIYHIVSRVTFQNISPSLTRKPWRVMSSNAKGKGWHNALEFRVTDREGLIFWFNRPRRHMIYVIWHFNLTNQIKLNTLLVNLLNRFKIPFLCLLCFATASLYLEPDLISMQNKYTRCNITVSCVA